MEYKLALNIAIFILVCYIVIRLLRKQFHIKQFISESSTEPFSLSNSAESELKYITDTSTTAGITRLQGVNKTLDSLPIKEFCIKSSYGSATTGKYVHLDMVKHVLSRGCRLLDFDVFYAKDGDNFVPKVGFSSDVNNYFIESKNSLLLDDVFSTIAAHAFSQTSPNRTDPLFINIRIKSNDSAIYSTVAKSIDAKLKSILYSGKVSRDTPFKDLMNKQLSQ